MKLSAVCCAVKKRRRRSRQSQNLTIQKHGQHHPNKAGSKKVILQEVSRVPEARKVSMIKMVENGDIRLKINIIILTGIISLRGQSKNGKISELITSLF